MFTQKDIITIGESLIELSSSSSLINTETFDKSYGGDTLVSAIAAIKTGSMAGYITKVGNDHFGEYLLDAWQAEGLDISQVKLANGINGVYFLAKENEGSKTTYYRKKTAACNLGIEDINFEYIKSANLVYTTGFVQSLSLSCAEVVREIFSFAKKNNILTAYDINFSDKVWSKEEAKDAFESVAQYIDVLFLNTHHDAPALFGFDSADKIIKHICDMAIPTVVVKEKNDFVYAISNGENFKIECKKTTPVDSTGSSAGFNGVFLSYFLKEHDILSALKHANACEFLQTQKVGAVKSIPSKLEIEKYCEKNYV